MRSSRGIVGTTPPASRRERAGWVMSARAASSPAGSTARWDDGAHHGHDLVFRVDESQAKPKLLRTYAVGKGDIETGNNVASVTMPRFDYETVALLPDGKIAVTFVDSTCLQPSTRDPKHDSPEVAILV